MNTPTRAPRSGCLSWGTLVLVALAVAAPVAAEPVARPSPPGQDPLVTLGASSAEVRFPTPVRHAILLRKPEEIRTVYARGDVLFHPQDPTQSLTVERVDPAALVIRKGPRGRAQTLRVGSPLPGFPALTFSGTVLLEVLHYRYQAVDRPEHPDPVLVGLEGARALLQVKVPRTTSLPTQPAPTPPLPGESRADAGPASPAPPPTDPARALLDGDLLEKVRVRETGPGLYEVNAGDVETVLENTGRVLADLAPLVLPTLTLKTGLQYQITSAAGDGVLTGQGFTLTAPKLAARAGLEAGDTILSVNGQAVAGFASLYRIFREVRRDPTLHTVQVELDRRGSRLTKTYRIR
jgi:hypothetical protein